MTLLRYTTGIVSPKCTDDIERTLLEGLNFQTMDYFKNFEDHIFEKANFLKFYKGKRCLAYKLDSPSNCETKEMTRVNNCMKRQYFCRSDLKQTPIKVIFKNASPF